MTERHRPVDEADRRRDAGVRPEDEPFTNIQTDDEPLHDDEGRAVDAEDAEPTARDDVVVGFERPPVRPRIGEFL